MVVTGRNAERIAQVAAKCDQVSPKGYKAFQVVGDVGVEADCDRLLSEIIRELGQLDVLVNNAGKLLKYEKEISKTFFLFRNWT